MPKFLPLARHAAFSATLVFMASGATAQTSPPGRTAFDKNGCQSCHAYSSRRGAPSVRDMLAEFEGEPESALKGIEESEKHTSERLGVNLSKNDRRTIAEWIAGTTFPEPEPVRKAEPPLAASVPVVIAPPVSVAAPSAAIDLAPAAPEPVVAGRGATGKLIGLAIEPGKKTDRLILTLSGKNPDDLDIKSVDGQLIISLPGVVRGAAIPASVAAARTARAVSTVQSIEQNGTLTVTVAPRTGELKYVATQGRNRLSIELSTVPSKKRPAPIVVAAAPLAAMAATTKALPLLALPKAKVASAAVTERPVAAQSETVARPKAAAQSAPTDDAKLRLEAKARQEADLKAKKEAETQARLKKESEEKAAQVAKKDADDKARRESSVTSKAEADMLASLMASAEAMKKNSGTETKVRKDRSKMKAPDKFRDEPCPPLAESDPIGTVDEARAKDIIERIGCPQCHAFVQKKTGPPFKRVFEKVKGNPSCVIKNLKTNKEHKDEGVTDDLKGPEFKIVADYIASRAK